jgi:prepilin-type processing-associated H-X9-DG protein
LKQSHFKSGTRTTNSDFATLAYPCPDRLKENHYPNGAANILFFDYHVAGSTRRETH